MYYPLVLGEIYVPKGSRRGIAPGIDMPQCHLDITGST
jgi:hypothetical protein